jgi:hypothetical protein
MENTLADVHMLLQGMREALLQDGSVMETDDTINVCVEAKKKVLWPLDLLTAEVAGAEQHIANFQGDDIFSSAEKKRMEQDVVKVLKEKLMLEDLIKDYSYCLRRHFQHLDDENYPVVFGDGPRDIQLERRHVVREILTQVELIDSELEDLRCGLCS